MKKFQSLIHIVLSCLAIVLLISGCKNVEKTGALHTTEMMWGDFIASNPQYATIDFPDIEVYGGTEVQANELASLIKTGKKTASSGLYLLYEKANVALPENGTLTIVGDWDENPQVIIKQMSIDTIPFSQITNIQAQADLGKKENVLKDWREVHKSFFGPVLERYSESFTEDILIVYTTFEVVR